MKRLFDVNTSVLASSVAAWRGTASFRPARLQPEKPLELYDMEGSPYCRLVREALTEMDLDAMILPCPAGGSRFRTRARAVGGKEQFPFLVDPNTGARLYESADIIEYLARTYEARARPTRGLARRVALGGSFAATVLRRPGRMRGIKARASSAPEQPLELYSFESSPFSRLVREVLCELELPYLLHNTGKARWEDMGPPQLRARLFPDLPVSGRNRLALLERTGRVQLPYFIDPNTGTEI
jgi:glutathione S-transferase